MGDYLAVGGPYDAFLLMSLAGCQLETASLPDILAILCMSGFDRVVFKPCHPFLVKLLEKRVPKPARSIVRWLSI